MGFRTVRGLKWARICQRPAGLPWVQARGAKAAGLRYERALARGIWGAKHGQWFEFEDSAGLGHCQTDVILDRGGAVLIVEAKYTWVEEGHRQLEQLYLPVVGMALETPTIGVVVCKVLTTETPRRTVHPDLALAELSARLGERSCLHWLGANLGPLQLPPLPSHLAPARSVA